MSLTSFFGTAWSVQATLVALVYPIVISLVAILLQRRASAKVTLRVYVLESGVFPAGASSMLLLGAMTLQYFLSPYAKEKWLIDAIVVNSAWLLTNIALTGYFLSRTVRFMQEEEGRRGMTRLALGQVLRKELEASWLQLLYAGLPDEWARATTQEPLSSDVSMHGFGSDGSIVVRRVKGAHTLVDVHSHLLRIVALRWTARARNRTKPVKGKHKPLEFVPHFTEVSTEFPVCRVPEGFPLTALERALVKLAFVYSPASASMLDLSTKEMVEEQILEVQSLAEQHRFAASRAAYIATLQFHENLLAVCEDSTNGSPDNAARLHKAPYAFFGSQSFHAEWLSQYRLIATLAVQCVEEDTKLFEAVTYTASRLAHGVKGQPADLLTQSLLVPQFLAYQLSEWWIRKMQSSGAASLVTKGVKLQEPAASTYRQAVVSFVGGWSDFEVRLPESKSASERWVSLCNRAQAYASHIEASARLILAAVERHDEEASTWYSDQFLKWWGIHASELKFEELDYEPGFVRVRFDIVEKTWVTAEEFLANCAGGAVSESVVERAVALSIRRYWEDMRLVVAGLLLAMDDEASPHVSLVLRVAGSLLSGNAFYPGNRVEADSLNNADSLLAAVLRLCFADDVTTRRLDSFCEKRRWDKDGPVVSGWIYGGSVPRSDVESLAVEFALALCASVEPNRPDWGATRKAICVWWNDPRKLERVGRFGVQLQRIPRSQAFYRKLAISDRLRKELDRSERSNSARASISKVARLVQKVAEYERDLTLGVKAVDPDRLSALTEQVGALAIEGVHNAAEEYPFISLKLGRISGASSHSMSSPMLSIEELTNPPIAEFSTSDAEYLASDLRVRVIEAAFADACQRDSIAPTLADTHAELLTAVMERCTQIAAVGTAPVVLVSNAQRSLFRPPWEEVANAAVPDGVILRRRAAGDEPFVQSYINDFPVFCFGTPGAQCYVVPRSMLSGVTINGDSLSRALAPTFVREGSRKVSITWYWVASFDKP